MTPPLPPPQEVLDLLPDAVCIVDADGHFLFVNASFERILGYAPSDVVGRRVFEFINPDDLDATLQQVDQVMSGEVQRHFCNRYIHKDGHSVDMQWSARWHPQHGVRIGIGREITELRRAECALEHMAHHDQLTGLPNRHHLLQELKRELACAQDKGEGLALLYIDMDGFKAVNDRCGHEAGDRLLREVATRLRQSSRSGDTPARIGGDEFVIIMPGCSNASDARRHAQLVRSKINPPYSLSSGEVRLDASIGVALFPLDGEDPSSLLAHADRDMYAVKSNRQD